MQRFTNTAATDAPTLAKPLAPEDVRDGDFVAVLDVEYEWPASSWYCDPPLGSEKVIRARLRPHETSPPLRVIDACLPFVCVEPPTGPPMTLDLRAVRLVRLDAGYAERVTEALAKATPAT